MGCLADKIDSWMRGSWALKKSKYSWSSRLSSPVSGSFFPICAKRTIRFRGNSVPLPQVSGTVEDELHTKEVHSKAKALSWRQNGQPYSFSLPFWPFPFCTFRLTQNSFLFVTWVFSTATTPLSSSSGGRASSRLTPAAFHAF